MRAIGLSSMTSAYFDLFVSLGPITSSPSSSAASSFKVPAEEFMGMADEDRVGVVRGMWRHRAPGIACRGDSRTKEMDHLVLTGEYHAENGEYGKVYAALKRAAELAEGEEKGRLIRRAVEILLEGAGKIVSNKRRIYKSVSSRSAGELEGERIDDLMLSAEQHAINQYYDIARDVYEKAIGSAQGEERLRIARIAAGIFISAAEKYLQNDDHIRARTAYRQAAEVEQDRARKIAYLMLYGEHSVKSKNYDLVSDAYINAIELADGEEKEELRKMALETLRACAGEDAERNDYWSASSAYKNAARFVIDMGEIAEFFSSVGDSYMKAENYEGSARYYSMAADLAYEDGDGERVIPLLKKLIVPAIMGGIRSEVLERLVLEYDIEDDARLLFYNVRTDGGVPGIDDRIRKKAGIDDEGLEYLKETIRYLLGRIISEVDAAEILSSNPKEFYELIRLGVIPFHDLLKHYEENRGEVEDRALKKTNFDPASPLHMAVEYGRYLGEVRSMSPMNDELKLFLTYEEFRAAMDKPFEALKLDEAEAKYLSYEVDESARVIKRLVDAFGGVVLVGNLRTGEYYADLIARQLKDDRLFHSIARMGSTVLHSQEYFLKGDLLDRVTVKNITSVKARPVVVVDATGSPIKGPDAFKGYMSWAAGFDILLFKARGDTREQIVETVSELTLLNDDVVDSLYEEATNTQSSFYRRTYPWIKHNPHRKRPVRIYVKDMDGVNKYRVKRTYSHDNTNLKEIKLGLPEHDEETVPMILLQPSMRIDNIPAAVQERIGTSKHRKGYLDENLMTRFAIRATPDGVKIVSNIGELLWENISD